MSKVVAVFEKPKICRECPCVGIPEYDNDYCMLDEDEREIPLAYNDPIPDWCPLIDVKEKEK